jgi:uncharacterized membrane protein
MATVRPDTRSWFVRPWHTAWLMLRHGAPLLLLVLLSLGLGMGIYHWVEGLDYADAFLNSAMLLGGMGPISPIKTTLGKWLVGTYALFAGLVFLLIAGVMLTPVIHHLLERLHIERLHVEPAESQTPSPAPSGAPPS